MIGDRLSPGLTPPYYEPASLAEKSVSRTNEFFASDVFQSTAWRFYVNWRHRTMAGHAMKKSITRFSSDRLRHITTCQVSLRRLCCLNCKLKKAEYKPKCNLN